MVKFSVIIPVYNVEEYISKCLDSLLDQTYNNFEVLVINDGSKDSSQKIIDKYVKKDNRFKSFVKKNGGLSDARNYGVKHAKGEYILFVDGDDTITSELLEILSKHTDGDVDLIKFGVRKVLDDGNLVDDKYEYVKNVSGIQVFPSLLKHPFFVTAVSYAYKREFWIKNNFEYSYGRLHEDFGLTPYVVILASRMTVIDYVGYNYYYRSNSIMGNISDVKLKKKNDDMLYFFDLHIERISNLKIDDDIKNVYCSYIANALINRCSLLKGKILKDYLNELKMRNISCYLLSNTIGRKIKKAAFSLCPKLYIKIFVK